MWRPFPGLYPVPKSLAIPFLGLCLLHGGDTTGGGKPDLPAGAVLRETYSWEGEYLRGMAGRLSPLAGKGTGGVFALEAPHHTRETLGYRLDFVLTPDWDPETEGPHQGLFTLGRNMSGKREGNSLSLISWKGRTLMARLTDCTGKENATVTANRVLRRGEVVRLSLLVDGHRVELYVNGERAGVATLGGEFQWPVGKAFFIGGESETDSRLSGRIEAWTLTLFEKKAPPVLSDAGKAFMGNPYRKLMATRAEAVLANGPRDHMRRHQETGDPWILRSCAEDALFLAHAHGTTGSPFHRSEAALAVAQGLLSELFSRAPEGRWTRANQDPNLDRFILVPLAEALRLLEPHLSKDLATGYRRTFKAGLEEQRRTFGATKSSLREAYPNMDVYYAFLLWIGSRWFPEEGYSAEYGHMLEFLSKAQYPDGAWMYIDGSNENAHYHEMLVCVLGLLARQSGDPRAWLMVRKSIPYYPLIHMPGGAVEYATDPFWKHNWEPLPARGPDTVASLTGDGANRFVARGLARTSPDFLDYCAAEVYTPGEEAPVPLERWGTDRNIEGPRGHFTNWSWVASARHCSDTLVGIHSSREPGGEIEGLLAVRAEIASDLPPEKEWGSGRMALGMPPHGTRGETRWEGETAVFSATYPMACFRSFWKQTDPFPYRWTAHQTWSLGRTEVTGKIRLVSEADQSGGAPVVRFVFGANGRLEQAAPGVFTYGAYRLELLETDLKETGTRQVPISAVAVTRKNGAEVFFTMVRPPSFGKGQAFQLRVKITRP